MKYTILIVATTLLIGCSSSKTTTPTEVKVEKENSTVNNTLAALNKGKNHFQAHCASCHDLPNPTSKTVEQWNKIVPRMVSYINGDATVLDEKAQENILAYLLANRNGN